ncbi:MAG: methylated-DNA--[protein]-cysteine S-methyltransferase [Acidobacteriota bacterium]|nr:methylated-DNA--[protein]-cysteine S-methyltransferase [Acidobacteriota bacterium]
MGAAFDGEGYLVRLDFLAEGRAEIWAESASKREDQAFGFLKAQMDAYFRGSLRTFNVPHRAAGTDFQRRVWAELECIPFGKAISYLELAQRLGDRKCIRAAGRANGANPISVLIPCHRVIGSDGSLVGYGGGLPRKQALLELEGAIPRHQEGPYGWL